jgi:hypothetical protein
MGRPLAEYRAITPTAAAWDAFLRQQPHAHVLQQAAWGELKGAFGWSSDCVALTDPAGQIVAGAQLLFKPLPLRLGTMAYLAMGPIYSSQFTVHSSQEESIGDQRPATSFQPREISRKASYFTLSSFHFFTSSLLHSITSYSLHPG